MCNTDRKALTEAAIDISLCFGYCSVGFYVDVGKKEKIDTHAHLTQWIWKICRKHWTLRQCALKLQYISYMKYVRWVLLFFPSISFSSYVVWCKIPRVTVLKLIYIYIFIYYINVHTDWGFLDVRVIFDLHVRLERANARSIEKIEKDKV